MKSCLRIARYSRLVSGVTLVLVVSLAAACRANTAQGSNPNVRQPIAAATAILIGQVPAGPAITPTVSTTAAPMFTPTPQPPLPAATPAPTSTSTVVAELSTTPPALPNAAAQTMTASSVKVSKTIVTLPTYPFRDYLVEQVDPVYNMPVYYFDRPAYEAAAPSPKPVDYAAVVLENAYLRLTFLPELGGRLYSAVVKATGQEIFYHNPVVKPSRYGVLQPAEANWWLATGGMEWAYPTQEHGYRWGVPWSYDINQSSHGVTITLSDVAPDRVGATVSVTLPADSAAFTVSPKLINNGPSAVPVQFWLNAALTLGLESMSRRTEFMIPTAKIVIHSRGEAGWNIPESHLEAAWPQVGPTDLREYRQWANYLGFFVPHLAAPFMGAYNPAANLGVVRLIEPGAVPGSKLFAFGLGFSDRSYTDDDSQYFEIWGGANAGFWPEDNLTVPAGGTVQWQESWWPLAGLGGLTWADQDAAIFLSQNGAEDYTISLLVSHARPGTLVVLNEQGTPLFTTPFTADPAASQQWSFTTPNRPAQVQIKDDNSILLNYQPIR